MHCNLLVVDLLNFQHSDTQGSNSPGEQNSGGAKSVDYCLNSV
jgi:hypothetical protein